MANLFRRKVKRNEPGMKAIPKAGNNGSNGAHSQNQKEISIPERRVGEPDAFEVVDHSNMRSSKLTHAFK